MKIMTLNCRVWWRDMERNTPHYWRNRYYDISNLIRAEKPDILCLQELLYPATRYIPEEYKRVTHGISHSIWVKRGLNYALHGWHIHYDWVDFLSLNDTCVRVVNVHGHWNRGVTARLRKALAKMFDKPAGRFVIAAGDFNVSYEDAAFPADCLWYYHFGQDTFRNYDRPEDSHGEIDLVFDNGEMMVEKRLLKIDVSDHLPIIIECEDYAF